MSPDGIGAGSEARFMLSRKRRNNDFTESEIVFGPGDDVSEGGEIRGMINPVYRREDVEGEGRFAFFCSASVLDAASSAFC